jgi:Na+/H+ antiporter NhaD/arsenite permease-like protein
VLLIRPLLRANAARQHARHVVIFFIFVVSNAGGLLTPLGDPPLFLGFLRGVPFTWTFRLFPAWLLLNGMLLGIFFLIDRHLFRREQRARPNLPASGRLGREPLRIEGAVNLVWLAAVPAVIAVLGAYGSRWFGRGALATIVPTLVLGGITVASLATTSAQVHRANAFSWTPIIEVAAVFLGIFVTMIPALGYLQARGGSLGLTEPWQFFWVAGSLSSFLDNAPTYLTFTSVAVGLLNQTAGSNLVATDLGGMAAHPVGGPLLAAISCGSVFMGAVTYIGNGPNFMVKAIAEQTHVRMPGFFGYMLWSGAILLPLFLALTFVLF